MAKPDIPHPLTPTEHYELNERYIGRTGFLESSPIVVHAVDRWKRASITYQNGSMPLRMLVRLSDLKFKALKG